MAGRQEDVPKQLHALLVVLHHEDLRDWHRYAPLAGSVKTNVLPLPSSLSTQILPPCSSTSRFESARPRPVPSPRSIPASVCWNSSKTRLRSSAAMPGPVSATETLTSPLARVARTSTAPPAGVNFTAFESRLKITCLMRRSSPETTSASRVRCQRDEDTVLHRALAHHRDAALEGFLQRERRELELDLPRFDLGEVEHVVDEREQVVSGGQDVVEVLRLLFVDIADHPLAQHLREADDRVQRRPQLVRHVGEEVRLVLAGRLELPVEAPELIAHPVHVRGQRT